MKKKLIISFAVILIIGILAMIFVPIYKIDKTFTYEIDKEKGEVTITGYLGDENAEEKYKHNLDELVYPEKIEVPEKIKGCSVTAIGDRAFEWSKAKEVVLPDTVIRIEDNAFNNCENLESITGTDNVEVIGQYGMSGCMKLEGLYVPNLKDMGASAFAGNEKMKEVYIPDTITTIPYAMCMGMDALEAVEIPDSVKSIETLAFAFCRGLKSVYIPSSVTYISDSAFDEIENKITIHGEKGSYAEEYANTMGINFQEASQYVGMD